MKKISLYPADIYQVVDKSLLNEHDKLILRADYGGYGIAGQDLSSGTIIKVYNVNDNDTFFEDIFGWIWELNIENTSEKGSTILKINQIGLEEKKNEEKNKDN